MEIRCYADLFARRLIDFKKIVKHAQIEHDQMFVADPSSLLRLRDNISNLMSHVLIEFLANQIRPCLIYAFPI